MARSLPVSTVCLRGVGLQQRAARVSQRRRGVDSAAEFDGDVAARDALGRPPPLRGREHRAVVRAVQPKGAPRACLRPWRTSLSALLALHQMCSGGVRTALPPSLSSHDVATAHVCRVRRTSHLVLMLLSLHKVRCRAARVGAADATLFTVVRSWSALTAHACSRCTRPSPVPGVEDSTGQVGIGRMLVKRPFVAPLQ